jgi:hypothetical protein
MKPIYRQHLQAALDDHFARELPGFAATPLKLSAKERKGATLFVGSRLYVRTVPEGSIFIHLIPHRRQEKLLAEVGWSATGRFPVELSSHGPITKPADELREPEWLIDFGEIYHRKYGLGQLGWDVWTCSASFEDPNYLKKFVEEDLAPVSHDQARERAESAAAACVKDLRDVAIPYLDEWINSRRLS